MTNVSTRGNLEVLTAELAKRYEAGESVRVDISGKPKLHILGLQPLAYEQYGKFHNKAPYLYGSLVLRCFFSTTRPGGGADVFAGVEESRHYYGFEINGDIPASRNILAYAATILGHPELAPQTSVLGESK